MEIQIPEHPMTEELDRAYDKLIYLASGMQGIGYALSIAQEDDVFGNSVVQDLGCAAIALGEATRYISHDIESLSMRANKEAKQ